MAFTLESAGRVRTRTLEFSKSPAILLSLKALFLHLSMYKKGQDLALLPFTSAGTTTATTGEVIGSGTATIYAVYGKKQDEGTAAYLVIGDNATNVAGASSAREVVLKFTAGEEEVFLVHPDGIPIGTGIVAFSATDGTGTTLSGADEAPNGFIIIGA